MNQEIKKRWVDALRSGDYEQGRERLNASGRFCCLGVLCDILKDEAGIKVKLAGSVVLYDGLGEVLPRKIVKFAKLPDFNPGVGDLSLAQINDGGATFNEIADLIEAEL